MDGVVPVAVKPMRREPEGGKLFIRDGAALRIRPAIQLAPHAQAGGRPRGAPRQLRLMYEKSRCSMVFHLLVPINDEGLADAGAANPFGLPRLHAGIGDGASTAGCSG